MGNMTIKDLVDLVPTIGIVGVIAFIIFWAGNNRRWVYGWQYDEMKANLTGQIDMWKEKYEKMNAAWIEVINTNSRVADKALDKKEKEK